jgi:hypothetical protein
MIEKPLERLNYYNGQRLEASDLKLEQDYHIRVRRWLNRSLYAPGIARGLEVREKEGTRTVIISPGVALDAEGHEIILLEEAEEIVPGRGRQRSGTGSTAEVEGLYLTIRYDEQTVAEERGVCFARVSGEGVGYSRPASGGPARISARPVFNWRAFPPDETSGEIVLAQVELDKDCKEVSQVDVGVRRYVGAASSAKVHQFALEGERDVAYIPGSAADRQPVGRIYFHIRGRQPNAVTLYLRAQRFPTLYYTELGHVAPTLHLGTGIETLEPVLTQPPEAYKHRHKVLAQQTQNDEAATEHGHRILFATEKGIKEDDWLLGRKVPPGGSGPGGRLQIELDYEFQLGAGDWALRQLGEAQGVQGSVDGGRHRHTIPQFNTETESISFPHKHTVSPTGSIDSIGVTDPSSPSYSVRAGDPLEFVDGMQVLVNGVDMTNDILGQLSDANSTDWPSGSKLGDGSSNHQFVLKGSGPIRLDFLPDLYFTEGEYYIELRIPRPADGKANGGRVLYNLYIE